MEPIRSATFVLVLLCGATLTAGTQSTATAATTEKTPERQYWTDPDTGLTWAARDSGKDLSWKSAVKYCRNLRLADYSDWRLADMFELQGIFDKTAVSPGLTGRHSKDPTEWHVRGNLFLTAYEWSNHDKMDDRDYFNTYAFYFDFGEGKSDNIPTGWPYPYNFMRALCVRGSGDPLGGQRKH